MSVYVIKKNLISDATTSCPFNNWISHLLYYHSRLNKYFLKVNYNILLYVISKSYQTGLTPLCGPGQVAHKLSKIACPCAACSDSSYQ